MHGAGADVLELGPHERPALARLDVLEVDHLEELAVDLEHEAVPEIRGSGHMIEQSQSIYTSSTSSVRPSDSRTGPSGPEVDVVLQPHPAPARKIDPRLDRHHRVQRQRRLGGGRQPRRLVHLEAEPVAQRVAERVAEAPGRDDLPRQRVALPAGHAGTEVLERAALGGPDQLVDRPLALVRARPDDHGAGEIGAVSVHLRAEVKQQPLARPARPRRWSARGAAPSAGRMATMVGNGCHSLPRRRSAASSAAAISSSVWPGRTRRQHLGQRSPAPASAAARMAATSSGDLTARSRSTRSLVGTTRARVRPATRSASRTRERLRLDAQRAGRDGGQHPCRAAPRRSSDRSPPTAAAPASCGACTA